MRTRLTTFENEDNGEIEALPAGLPVFESEQGTFIVEWVPESFVELRDYMEVHEIELQRWQVEEGYPIYHKSTRKRTILNAVGLGVFFLIMASIGPVGWVGAACCTAWVWWSSRKD